MLNIVLVEPEIPQNTGNISRTCACTGTRLHLVRPYGFELSERTVKRAGLDYWDKLDLYEYDNLEEFFARNNGGLFYYLSTKANKNYAEVTFPDGCYLIFGKETRGLDPEIIRANPDTALRIPMGKNLRSLNLSNSVAIVLYEALRQNNFFDLI